MSYFLKKKTHLHAPVHQRAHALARVPVFTLARIPVCFNSILLPSSCPLPAPAATPLRFVSLYSALIYINFARTPMRNGRFSKTYLNARKLCNHLKLCSRTELCNRRGNAGGEVMIYRAFNEIIQYSSEDIMKHRHLISYCYNGCYEILPARSSRRALMDLITAIKPRQVFASGEEILIKSARSLLSRRKVRGGVIDRRIDYHKNYRSRLVKPRFIESLCTRIKRNPFNGESTLLRKRDTGALRRPRKSFQSSCFECRLIG